MKKFDLAIEVLKEKIAELVELSADDDHWRDMDANLIKIDLLEEAAKVLESVNE